MKIWPLLFFAATCSAQTLTLTAPHLTMEQGGQVPPLVWTQSSYPTTCTGFPTLSTTATSGSAVGTYAITAAAGTFACTGFTITYVGNNLNVIAADGNGAQINNSVTYPPSFLSGPTVPAINVTSNSIANLVGDGTTDNTTNLNTLLSHYDASCGSSTTTTTPLYFPAGIYLVSGQIIPCVDKWIFYGAGPQSSIIRLKPNSAAFNTGTNIPWFNPTSVGGNSNFIEFVYNIGFDIGYGNPNAFAFATAQNNVGAERNVIFWSEDGNCPYLVDFSDSFPGPGLFKNVAMYGCASAIHSTQVEYMWTFDQITTEGQTGTAINSGAFKMAIQHWLSDNAGTALANGANGGISILDSELLNGGSGATAITNASGGSVFVRNVTVAGYGTSEVDTGTGTPVTYTGNLTQNWTGTAQTLFSSAFPPTSLYLPQKETPLPTDDPTQSNWTALGTNQNTWCAAITGSTSVTVYAPPGAYSQSGTINCTVPDTVNHLQFYNANFFSSPSSGFTFTVAGTSSTPLVIDGCPWTTCSIVHTGSRTVVLMDSTLSSYTASSSAGQLFLEDVVFGTYPLAFQPQQSIWARQLNLENGSQPNFTCNACTLWVLGYKTESSSVSTADPTVVMTNGGRAEIFTQFVYPLATAAAGSYVMSATNSSIFVAPVFEFVNVNGNGFPTWVQETQGTVTRTLATPSQNTGNYLLNVYYSYQTGSLNGATLQGGKIQ